MLLNTYLFDKFTLKLLYYSRNSKKCLKPKRFNMRSNLMKECLPKNYIYKYSLRK